MAVPVLMGNRGCSADQYPVHPKIEPKQECAGCHDDRRTVKTVPEGHTLEWKTGHGSFVARYGMKAQSYCALCHTDSSCSYCHQQNMPTDHTDFWRLKAHGVTAGLDRSRCYACHRSDFCQRCHSGVPPQSHNGAWGSSANMHCMNCHFPMTTAGAENCAVCHSGTPSHTSLTPAMPSNAIHVPSAVCLNCHTPLRHPNNGQACTTCHSN